jgi:hypothetical protein
MKRFFTVLFSILLLTSGLASVYEVIEETDNSLTVKFTLPEYKIEQTGNYSEIFCLADGKTSHTGYAELPYFSNLVGLPVNGDMQAQIVEQNITTKHGVQIQPAPKLIYKEDKIETEAVNPILEKQNFFYPQKKIKLGEKAFIGDRYFGSFQIYPFQYNAATKSLQIAKELTIQFTLHGKKTISKNWRSSNNYIDQLDSDFCLNNETSKKWRLEKEINRNKKSYRNENIVDSIQLLVAEEGIYKISYQYLTDSLATYWEKYPEYSLEFDWDTIDPRFLQLTDKDGPVPIRFVGEADGSFDPGDYFEFWGEIHHGENTYYDDYSSVNVYELTLHEGYGCRMAVENGGIQVNDESQFVVPESFPQTIHFEEQNIKDNLGAQFGYNPNFFREDIWFWKKIDAPKLNLTSFNLEYPHDSGIRKFYSNISVWGLSDTEGYEIDHHAICGINSVLVDDIEWSGQRQQIFANASGFPNTYLNNGQNTIYIRLPGIPGIGDKEHVLLDYFEMTYWREYKTDKDYMKFSRPDYNYAEIHQPYGLYQFELENFSSPDVSVYKLGSSYMENLRVESFYQAGGAPYKITFQDSVIADNIQYFAVTENNKKKPVKIQPDYPSNLKLNSNGADYVIITPQKFKFDSMWEEMEEGLRNGVKQYAEIWQQQGYNTKVVYLQDIFDEFNHSIRSAEAIKDFISFAYYNWAQRPSHILFMGDGITDERDYNEYLRKQKERYNLIPFRNVWVNKRGAIASDNWFGCVVGDDIVADVSIGRINIWEPEQIYDMADKATHYLENPNYPDLWHSRFTFAAGGNPSEGTFFAEQSERIIKNNIPADYHIARVYCNTDDIPDEYGGNTTSLISNINDGTLYVQFMGHGGGYVWADYNLLNKADVATFNNENFPLFASLSCYGSAFNYPQSSCIGEELILQAGKGAIGHMGFTGYGYENADEYFGNYLNQGIINENVRSLGEISDYTKAKFFSSYGSGEVGTALIQGCALLGDPMIRLTLPLQENDIDLTDYNVNEGDSLDFSAAVSSETIGGKYRIYNENDVQIPFTQFYPFEIPAVNSTITYEDFVVPEIDEAIYQRNVKLFSYSNTGESVGSTNFTVGKTAYVNLQIEPTAPTQNDSINISADFFDKDGIQEISCYVVNYAEIPMELVTDNRYELTEKIPPTTDANQISYYFKIIDNQQQLTETELQRINFVSPDLVIRNYRRSTSNGYPVFQVLIQNSGDNQAPASYLKLYDLMNNTLMDSVQIGSFETMEERWENLNIPLLNDNKTFKIIVNENGESFAETNLYNNATNTEQIELNLFELTAAGQIATSLDNNAVCEMPANLFEQNTVLSLLKKGSYTAINQPDIVNINFADESESPAYEISIMNEELLADSLGHLPQGKEFQLQFYYSATDSLTQLAAQQGKLAIYRWQADYEKWVIVGGELNTEENYIETELDMIGNYSVFQNNDSRAPTIEANVEGQEFTHGGFISKDGVISFTMSDANGIDIFSQTVAIYLDSQLVPQEDYSQSFSYGNLVHVPLKYQLNNLDKGDHTLALSCTDVNGNYQELVIRFVVSNQFDIIQIANYPNPVKSRTIDSHNEGRTRFTYTLTDSADEVTIKIYTVSGRLVRTFKNLETGVGYHEFPRKVLGWDCRDKDGFYLANGVYFYKIIAKKGNKTIEKTKKMAILK